MRNLYRFTKIYSGGEPELVDGDVFKTMVPLSLTNGLPNNNMNGKKVVNDTTSTINELEKSREKSREKILALMKGNGQITTEEMAISLNLSIKGIEKNIRSLKKSGLIERIGTDKGGYWKVN